MTNQTMYEQNVYFPDVFKGCKHDCIYCKPSFQRQAKRQKQSCKKCYTFEPHLHPERLQNKAPATKGEQFIFFPKGGDLAFAQPHEILELIRYTEKNPQATFLIQTKAPEWMRYYKFPDNVILDITWETNRTTFHTCSNYCEYSEISKANLTNRISDFLNVKHSRKAITIEPILQFDLSNMVNAISAIRPEFVYVGYDTKGCKLPEPKLKETLELLNVLSNKGYKVRPKTLKKAWYESTLLDCEIKDQKPL